MGVVIVEGKGQFWGEFGAFHCNQWGLCDALFSNYFEDLFLCAIGLHVMLWWFILILSRSTAGPLGLS